MRHRLVLIGSIVCLSAASAPAQVLQHEAVDPAASIAEMSPSFQKFLDTLIDNYNDLADDSDAKVLDRECESNHPLNCDFTLGDKARLSTISYGKERPLCTESDESCWSQNRRGVSAINQ